MDSVDVWFSDSDDEESERLVELARTRRMLRDSSNPLELEENMYVYGFNGA